MPKERDETATNSTTQWVRGHSAMGDRSHPFASRQGLCVRSPQVKDDAENGASSRRLRNNGDMLNWKG